MSEHEIIELLLFYSLPRINTNEIAHLLINEFGSLKNVLNAPPEELIKVANIGPVSAVFIKFINDLCNDYDNYLVEYPDISTTEKIKSYFQNYFSTNESEDMLLLSVDCRLCVRDELKLNMNMLNDTEKKLEIADFVVKNKCRRLIFGINHRNGTFYIQNSDIDIIRLLKKRIRFLDITIIDCIIYSEKRILSVEEETAFSLSEM